jgi:hypothetical protein
LTASARFRRINRSSRENLSNIHLNLRRWATATWTPALP